MAMSSCDSGNLTQSQPPSEWPSSLKVGLFSPGLIDYSSVIPLEQTFGELGKWLFNVPGAQGQKEQLEYS